MRGARRPSKRWALVAVLIPWLPGCGGPVAPSAPEIEPPALSEVIEAIFLGTGPLAAGGCFPLPGAWHSFPRDTTVTVVFASTIDERGQETLERAVRDFEAGLGGRFRLATERTLDPDPVPGTFQITSADVPAARVERTCSPGGSGCANILSWDGPYYLSVRAIQLAGSFQRLKVHELGHALGLCHIKEDRMPEAAMADPVTTLAATSPSAEGRFSSLELEAIRAVYASALEPGATRLEFQRVGLVP